MSAELFKALERTTNMLLTAYQLADDPNGKKAIEKHINFNRAVMARAKRNLTKTTGAKQ